VLIKKRRCPGICPCITANCCGKTVFKIIVPKGQGQEVADQIIAARDNARRRTGATGGGDYNGIARVGTAVTASDKMER
jgi:hypothetical protein